MNIDIIGENGNKLLHRTEITARITSEGGTPTRKDVIKLIAAKKNVPEKLVIVDSIKQEYGKGVSRAFIKIYESESALKQIEPEYMIKRHEEKEEKKEGE